ncbi:unnamed protein product, partial [Rotaria socialis]
RVLRDIYPSVVEVCRKRNHSLTSTDSTPTATPNKKIKLIAGSPELHEETADENDDDE